MPHRVRGFLLLTPCSPLPGFASSSSGYPICQDCSQHLFIPISGCHFAPSRRHYSPYPYLLGFGHLHKDFPRTLTLAMAHSKKFPVCVCTRACTCVHRSENACLGHLWPFGIPWVFVTLVAKTYICLLPWAWKNQFWCSPFKTLLKRYLFLGNQPFSSPWQSLLDPLHLSCGNRGNCIPTPWGMRARVCGMRSY